jgi:translocation and assembly module TamB
VPEETDRLIVRRHPFGRIALFIALALLLVLVAAIAVVWIQRRPIAGHYLKGEFERRGVTASYHLDRVGLRTQEVSNLVIGDPRRPDLVARVAPNETAISRSTGSSRAGCGCADGWCTAASAGARSTD